MTTYHFTGPKVRAERKGTCPDCGKKVTRSTTIEHTVNPFNCKVVDGERVPKTWDEVRADCRAEAAVWQPRSWQCRQCEFIAWVTGLSATDLEWEMERGHRAVSTGQKLADKCADRIAIYEARLAELMGGAE